MKTANVVEVQTVELVICRSQERILFRQLDKVDRRGHVIGFLFFVFLFFSFFSFLVFFF